MGTEKIRQIAIISGKGGTGKTSLVAAFAHIHPGLVLADCDVDAANLHLLVGGGGREETSTEPFRSGFKAKVLDENCFECGRCAEVCRFQAVVLSSGSGTDSSVAASINSLSCEGCGCCADECSAKAISLVENTAGELLVSPSRYGMLVHARLTPGEGTSGKLVSRVRDKAREIAGETGAGLVLIDGSPGIGCPVIASITGTDCALIVTEPTVSGQHDLVRVAELCAHFDIPACAVINKCDINADVAGQIQERCDIRGIKVLGGIPFDPVFVTALTEGVTVMEHAHEDVSMNLKRIWASLLGSMGDIDQEI